MPIGYHRIRERLRLYRRWLSTVPVSVLYKGVGDHSRDDDRSAENRPGGRAFADK